VGCVIERVGHGEYSLIIPNTFNPTHRNFEDISEINIPTLCLYVVRIYFVAFLSLFGHSLRSESVVSLTLGLPKIGRLSRTRSRFILAGTCDSHAEHILLTFSHEHLQHHYHLSSLQDDVCLGYPAPKSHLSPLQHSIEANWSIVLPSPPPTTGPACAASWAVTMCQMRRLSSRRPSKWPSSVGTEVQIGLARTWPTTQVRRASKLQ
jgi:hypothetical protein